MAYVQSISGGGSSTASFPLTFANPNVAGNCIVVDFILHTADSAATITVTDSQGNTYAQIVFGQDGSNGTYAGCFVAAGIKAGANTVSVNYTGSFTINDIAAAIHEYSNIVATSYIDSTGNATFQNVSSSAMLFSTCSLTTGFAFDTIHAFGCCRANASVTQIPSNFTLRENTAVNNTVVSCDMQVSATPPTTQSFTVGFVRGHPGTLQFVSIIIALIEAKQPLSPGTAWMIIGEPVFTNRSTLLFLDGEHSFTRTLSQQGTASVDIYLAAASSYMPQTGWQVYLYDQPPTGAALAFAGKIDRVQMKWLGLNGDRIVTLSVVSFEQCFATLRVPPQSFFVEEAGDIFTSIFNSVAGGVPVTLGTVSDAFVINEIQFNWDVLAEAFTKLARSGAGAAQGCNWGIDLSTLTIYLKPPNATAAPYQIHNNQVAWESNIWEQNEQDYRNRQIVRGSIDAFAESSELFAFSGSFPQTFNLLRPAQTITGAWLTNNTQNTGTGTFTGNPSNGDTVTIGYPQTGSIYNWSPLGIYIAGQIIVDPSNHIQKCMVGGLSGNSQPTWNDSGGTTSDGPGTPNPTGLGGVVWQDLGVSGPGGVGSQIYTFVDVLDNTQWGQVLIGPTLGQTCQNLSDAINCTVAVQGQTFSWPTWENALVNSDGGGSATITVRNKAAGAGYQASLMASSSAFSWGSSTTSGGTTSGGTITLQVAQNGSSNTANIYYTPGSAIVAIASSPSTTLAARLQIQYQRQAGDCVIVEDTAAVNARAAIEGGTGKYQALLDDSSNTSNTNLLQEVQAALGAYLEIPIKWSFRVWKPGLQPGDLLDLSLVSSPAGLAALISANGPWLVWEVSAKLIPVQPWMDQSQVPGAGHYEYTITVINASQISDYMDFWEGLSSGSSSASSGFIGGGGIAPTSEPAGVGGWYTITPAGGNAEFDIANGFNQRVVLNGTAVNFLAPTWTGVGTIAAGTEISIYLDQDASGGRAAPTWTGGAGAFVSNTFGQITVDGTASTRTALHFIFDGSYWSLSDVPQTGVATS